MSKSKNTRDDIEAQEALEAKLSNAEKLKLADAKHKRTTQRYGIAVIVLLIAAVGAAIWNSGILQTSTAAATVNGQDVSVGELSYYYSAAMQDEMYNAYYYGTSAYDYTAAPKTQMYDSTSTYHDYFLDTALAEIQSVYGMLAEAESVGFTVDQETIDSQWVSVESSLLSSAYSSGLTSVSSYLTYNYGSYVTEEIYEKISEDQTIASAYVTAKADGIRPTDEELETYYSENADTLDTYTVDYMVLLATGDTTDEAGEALSTEEIAASLETNRATQESNANAILDALAQGEDFVTLGTDYDVYGAYEGDVYMGSYLNSSFSEWVMDESRQAGDTTVAVYEGTDRYVYYVVRFQDRVRDDSPTASVRHIFLSAGYDPTEEEYDAAYQSAVDLLAMWEEGGATEDYFAQMAYYYSADTSSSSDGGLISSIGATSGYVDTFTDWCLDESRYPGETGLVINEASDQKGWHIMYYVEETAPQWALIADASILSDALTLWHSEILAATSAQLGSGAQYVG